MDNLNDIIPVPKDNYCLAFAHALILDGEEKDSFEQALISLRKNEFNAYTDIKALAEEYLRHQIFGDRR